MSHCAACIDTEKLIGNSAGCAGATANISSTGTQNGSIRTLCSAGTKFQHLPACGGANHTICLGGDQALVVNRQQNEGFDQLCLNGRCPNGHNGFLGENRRTFRNCPNVTGELKVCQILQEFFCKDIPVAKVSNIFGSKMQLLNVIYDLFQTGGNGEATPVRTLPEEYIKVADSVLVAIFKIAISHGQFIEVTEHG